MRRRIMAIIGTRPEAIKMAPVILALQSSHWAIPIIVDTGQHGQLIDPVLSFFNIKPDHRLSTLIPDQSLTALCAAIIKQTGQLIAQEKPDCLIVQGDTSSAFGAALAGYYHHTPIAHVEAGLRTYDMAQPFPEEMQRRMIAHCATLHFAPTQQAERHLLNEGIAPECIAMSGNTAIDALHLALNRLPPLAFDIHPDEKLVLVTLHRRENAGQSTANICDAVAALAANIPHIRIIWPVHPNPASHALIYGMLAHIPNITLCDPMAYPDFLALMYRADLILTDSGGIQEEAPSLGKPVLILRDKTERPELLISGWGIMTGTQTEEIYSHAIALLTTTRHPRPIGPSPFGDGRSAHRIIARIHQFLDKHHSAAPKKRV